MKNLQIALAVGFFFALNVQGQGLKDAQSTLKIGNWTVLRSIDTMTDKVSCTGVYKGNTGIQLAANALYITVRGGIDSVSLRFGENTSRPMRLPTSMEKKVSAVTIEGSEFTEALQANRLRLQSLTLVRGLASEDLDTTGIQEAVEHIRGGCPPAAERGVPDRPSSVGAGLCGEQLLARLREVGVSEQQIVTACRN